MDLKDRRGFTLIEVMSVIVILAVVIAGVMDIYAKGINFWGKGEKKLEVRDNLRIGMDRMSRELRQAKYLTPYTTGGVLEFKNYDNTIVRYEVNGTNLKRNSEPLSNYITESGGLVVYWYPDTGPPENATRVKITLRGGSSLTDTFTLTTMVRLRVRPEP